MDPLDLAIIATDNIGTDHLKVSEESETEILDLEGTKDSENEHQKKDREARNKDVLRVYKKNRKTKEMRRKNENIVAREKKADKNLDQFYTLP